MFRTLLTTTAMVAILQAGAYAQDATAQDPAAPVPGATQQDNGAAMNNDTAAGSAAANDDATMQSGAAGTDTAGAAGGTGYYSATDGQILAENLIGKEVYNSQADDAEKIGSINDLVISSEGQAEAVIIGVGGFLGMGEKNVAVEFNRVQWVGEQGDERVVVQASKEELEGAPTFDTASMAPVDETENAGDVAMAPAAGNGMGAAPADPAGQTAMAPADGAATEGAAQDETAMAPADDAGAADAGTDTAAAPEAGTDAGTDNAETAAAPEAGADATATQDTETAMSDDAASGDAANDEVAMDSNDQNDDSMTTGAITDQPAAGGQALDESKLQAVDVTAVEADTLQGATVYNQDRESIGEVNDVIVTDDGNIEAFIVDVGGFLGIGEKSVAVKVDNIEFKQDENGSLMVFTPFTEAELEQQAAYDEDAYRNDDSGALVAPRT